MADTASAMISRVRGSSRAARPTASGCMSVFKLVHTTSSCTGFVAIVRQKRGHEVDVLGLFDIGENRGDPSGGLVLFNRFHCSDAILGHDRLDSFCTLGENGF